jgi:hypothetical protein
METIVETIDIDRPPGEVFAYATDLARSAEWQGSVVSATPHGASRQGLGAKAELTRKVGPRRLPTTEEIVQFDPPSGWTVRGSGGPASAIVQGKIEPLDDGSRSRATLALEFEPRGIGRLLVPLVLRRQARKQLPSNLQQLKRRLEAGTFP